MKTKEIKEIKGITLVALVVTIIVLLILATVSINLTIVQNGLFEKARRATNTYKESEKNETNELDGVETYIDEQKSIIDGGTSTPSGLEIEKSTDKAKTYTGNYADIDGDGTVDGIIYADLVTGAVGDGQWGNVGDGQWDNSESNYTIPTINATEAKSYYVSQETYKGPGSFGTGKVISPVKSSIGKERFYVMALSDIDGKIKGTSYCWYYGAYGKMTDYATYTSGDFGAGKTNTQKMIEKWNSAGYGAKDADSDYKDIWGQITEQVSKGWYVPSKVEWAAFGGEVAEKTGITKSNYANYNLSDYYLSSSQSNDSFVWLSHFYIGRIGYDTVDSGVFVRLAVTF